MVKRLRGGKLQVRGKLGPLRKTPRESAVALALADFRRGLNPLSIQMVATSAVRPSARNPRRHSDRQVSQLSASIRNFGFLIPLLMDEQCTLIAGHGRLAAAQQLGLTEVPVVRVDHLTEAQKRALRVADNRLAELSEWDPELLKIELSELSMLDLPFDVEITGFDTVDIDRITDASSSRPHDPADILPPLAQTAPISRQGDLWVLGNHRLLCGDACDPDAYGRLLGSTAQMVFTDPPYNVRIRGHVRTRALHREFPMASGEMSAHEFAAFLERTFRLMERSSQDGAIHFVCMDWRHIGEILKAAAPVYGEPKQLCVWVKDNGGMGSFYRSQHELVFVFKVGEAPHINNFGLGERGRYRTNVWRYPGRGPGHAPDR